jgi:hypothetical protein
MLPWCRGRLRFLKKNELTMNKKEKIIVNVPCPHQNHWESGVLALLQLWGWNQTERGLG